MNTPDTEWEKEFNARMIVVLDDGTEEYVWKPEVMREYIQSLLTSRDTYWKEQLQKARQDWLREEIVRLDVTYKKELEISFEEAHENYIHNHAIETIIDRYQKELDQPITNEDK